MQCRYLVYFLFFTVLFACQKSSVTSIEWVPISDCIADVAVDYESGIAVNNAADVEAVFSKFVTVARLADEDIFGLGTDWRFEETSPHGSYEGINYWSVSASWYDSADKVWKEQNVFDVSEDGKVVRLLGCI